MKKRKQNQSQQSVLANDLVIEETSLDLGLPKHAVQEVVAAQAEFTAQKIREGGFEGTMWPLFGKIIVKTAKVHKINDIVGGSEIRKNTSTPKP